MFSIRRFSNIWWPWIWSISWYAGAWLWWWTDIRRGGNDGRRNKLQFWNRGS